MILKIIKNVNEIGANLPIFIICGPNLISNVMNKQFPLNSVSISDQLMTQPYLW